MNGYDTSRDLILPDSARRLLDHACGQPVSILAQQIVSAIEQVARALFSFAREVAGYDTLKEGPGQEPVNAVFYQVRRTRYPRRALPEGSHFCSVCRQAKGAPCESSRLWPCSCCTAPRIALRRPIPQPLRWRV